MKRTITCPKCGGSGVIREFAHVDKGVCYRCLGTGSVEIYDGEKWCLGITDMTRSEEFDMTDCNVYYFSGTSQTTKITAKSSKWALKIYLVLSLWERDFRGSRWDISDSQKAWDKMIHLKNTKSGKEMAKLINTEYARAESRPYIKNKYYLFNADTDESVYCDKDGNPIKS